MFRSCQEEGGEVPTNPDRRLSGGSPKGYPSRRGILTWLFGKPNLEPQKEKSEPVAKAEVDRLPIERNPALHR